MFLTILGMVPYAVMGATMDIMGYGLSSYQFWTIWGCMIFSDAIWVIKAKLN